MISSPLNKTSWPTVPPPARIDYLAMVFSRSRMVMIGFVFGFLFRGPFLVTHDLMLDSSSPSSPSSSSSSSRIMTSIISNDEDASFQAPGASIRGGKKLSQQEHDDRPSSRQAPVEAARTLQNDAAIIVPRSNSTSASLIHVEKEVVDFEKQDKVVIAIKIHGPPYLKQLKQSLCLLTAAYNNRVQYDILLFHSEPLPDKDVQELQRIVHPARLLLEQDDKTLQQHLQGLDQAQTARLLKRCNVTDASKLEWWTRCSEGNRYQGADMPLRYNWQAEFRSKWIWYSKQLSNYRFMMWWDSDAMATKVWQQDPVAFMIRHELKVFFDHFPAGSTKGPALKEKIEKAYGSSKNDSNQTLCQLKLANGRLRPIFGHCDSPNIQQIHGFFHITDLDFYRNKENPRWFDVMIGNSKFSRQWDDQLAVTIPAAMRAANASWSMNHHGVKLDIYHNQQFDGQRRWRGGGYVHWYKNRSAVDFPESIATCKALVKNGG
jgi:hypothetical protein